MKARKMKKLCNGVYEHKGFIVRKQKCSLPGWGGKAWRAESREAWAIGKTLGHIYWILEADCAVPYEK